MNKNVLVTGGCGYIGSHTTIALIKAGYDVSIIDNLNNSTIKTLDRIEKITQTRPKFYKFDLKSREETLKFFEKHTNIDGIIHFAAFKAVGESVEKPLMYYRNNLESLFNILEGIKNNSLSNLVFSSSCTVYGEPDKVPVTEKSPVKKAVSPYGNTKQISEEIIKDFINSNAKIKAISLRYFNPIGAHPSGYIGELPQGTPNNLVPFVTQTAAGIREKISVFGNNYNTPDGTCLRDYIDIMDLANAHIFALERMIKNKSKNNLETFNIGTGKPSSVLDIIKTFEKVNNLKLNYKIADKRQGDIEKVFADPSLSNKILGWKAKIPLKDSLKNAWKWEKYYRNI